MRKEEIRKRLRNSGLTEFQQKVLLAITKIPKGETRSYKQVAAMAGRPKAYRAVGTTMRLNPLAPMVPCHRVIKSGGDLGNYSGKGGKRGKMLMLRKEGAL